MTDPATTVTDCRPGVTLSILNRRPSTSRCLFIPGAPAIPAAPLARYRTIQPVQAAGLYVERFTRPGDLVVDLFCQGPVVVREAVAAGRRALGLSVNPLLLVAARLGLDRPQPPALNAAFTRLADSPKGDVPLRRYLASLYRSACPACRVPGVAEWFAWDRDENRPFRKGVRCSRCAAVQEGVPDGEDLQAARRIQPHGLAYYYALDRVAPPADPVRERAAELVALYTPRNLSALMDLAMRLAGLEAGEEVRLALTAALLDCFDVCSSLDPYGEERPRPRLLRLPARYLERNVWTCFEERFSRLLAGDTLQSWDESGVSRTGLKEPVLESVPAPPVHGGAASAGAPAPPVHGGAASAPAPPVHGGAASAPAPPVYGGVPLRATDVASLVRGEAQGYALANRSARDVGEIMPPGSVALIFADPPRPDGVFWALSALWAGWLWESPAARVLHPFLSRRRFEWDWHWDVLRAALSVAGPLLAAGGHLVTLFSDPDPTLLESVCLAASSAGYALEGWGYSPDVGYRLVWRNAECGMRNAERRLQTADGGRQLVAPDVKVLERELVAVAADTAVSTLRERGEPAAWTFLHGNVYTELARQGLLARAAAVPEGGPQPFSLVEGAVRRALEAAPLVKLAEQEEAEGTLWWMADPRRAAEPLAERVELAVRDLLLQRPAWSLEELTDAVYARFPGSLTPDLALVRVCIASYSAQEGLALHLRPEDEPQRRAAELEAVRDALAALGKRLGFSVKRRGGGWDVRWLEEGREAYLFAVSATAVLSHHLLGRTAGRKRKGQPAGERAYRCLVLPGGRAQLAGLKLQRDPRLAQAVTVGGWRFIKFRHLRHLVAEPELDRHALKTVLGLDPIAEQEVAQIPLF